MRFSFRWLRCRSDGRACPAIAGATAQSYTPDGRDVGRVLRVLVTATNDNPVFYVQYAHARTVNVARNAAEAGVDRADGFDATLLDHPSESVLLGQIAGFPGLVAHAAELREPHRVARYLEELAGSYHKWYDQRRVAPFGDEVVSDTHRTRLWLNDATRQVLANGLELLGVSAPERM